MSDHAATISDTGPIQRRGRPVDPTKPSSRSLLAPYFAFLENHPALEEPKGFSLQLFLRRFDARTAKTTSANNDKPLAQRLAKAAGTSLHVATRIVAGLTPLTSNMVVAISKRIECTTDYLLTGSVEGSQKSDFSDEQVFLQHYRSADQVGKTSALFLLTLDLWLDSLPDEARDRLISSLVALHEAGAQPILAALPSVLRAFQARSGTDPMECFEASTIFTPVHEFIGVYGPEQKPLLAYL